MKYSTTSAPSRIVTGIYGMNFGEHPELGARWIYHTLSMVFLLSMPIMLYLFRRYKWL